uniref:Ig-like domain-containing protein n=1 Tax=Salvator merianae TaxID=96440 RepID=A0A8D0BDX1_SALMN
MLPQASWIKEVDKEDPQYWHRNALHAQGSELAFRDNINIAMNRYNQTGGLHIVQRMCGCELRGDGSKRGFYQDAYDGRDFIAFDKETLTWTAADAQAQMTKRKWDALRAFNQYMKSYLEEECIESLKKYLQFGNGMLLKKEPPEVKVTSRADYDNIEILICRADGFYPKDIEVVWTGDEKVWEQETLRGFVVPNSDGTYHTWISTKIDPKDKDRFRCRVDHASWKDPVDFAVKEPAFTVRPIVVCVVLGVLLVAVSTGFWLFWKKQHSGYREVSNECRPPPGIISFQNKQSE